ncbi:MAG: response regulator [bacterium]|nr:response regulator [bacterium]
MSRIRNLNIKTKLIAIIISITLIIMIITSSAGIILEKYHGKVFQQKHVVGVSKYFADDLSFVLDLQQDVEENAKPIMEYPGIMSLYIYNDAEEEVFGVDKTIPKIPPPPFADLSKFHVNSSSKYIEVGRPIMSDDDRFLGAFFIRISTEEVQKKTSRFVLFMVLLIPVLLILSFLLAQKMQGIISKPILHLVNVTKKVSLAEDYSIRVQKQNDDEIGMLYEEFNEMMEQILKRNIERDRVEGQLKNAKLFLGSVIESMPSLLIAVNKDGVISQWNKSAAKTTDVKAKEASGNILWKLIPDFHQFKETIDTYFKKEKFMEFYKKQIKIGDNVLSFNGSIFPLVTGDQLIFIIMLNNITETEKKEQQLRQSQKMETVGNLAGGLAHDFNNVLGGIIGTISLYKYKIAKKQRVSMADTEKHFNTIEESANRAANMVKQLLSLTRKQELTFAPADLNSTINHIINICSNTFDKSVEIETNYFPEKAMTYADSTQIEQCLLNLCINASHAMTIMRKDDDSQEGGKLGVSLKSVSVDKFFRQNHPEASKDFYWDISVSDTGVGMDQKTVARIFDPFFTTKSNDAGTGLGLAMVYNIIKQHEGFVKVYSQVGLGTTFHIYLAGLEFGEVPELPAKEEEVEHGQGLILVVDDEAVMRETSKSMLLECGYEVIIARNGEEAVNIYKKYRESIKAVLLDMVMPRKSGKETFIELIKINPDINVLLTSGFKQDERVESILKMGVKEFIQKPFTLKGLAATLHRLLNS